MRLKTALSIALLCSFSLATHSWRWHMPSHTGMGTQCFSAAISFLQAVYPWMEDQKYTLSLEAYESYDQAVDLPTTFTVSIGEGAKFRYTQIIGGRSWSVIPLPGMYLGPQYPRQIVNATFQFDPDGKLIEFETDWPITSGLRPAVFSEIRFGPDQKEELLAQIPRDALEKLLGKFDVTSTVFTPKVINSNSAASGIWTVAIKARVTPKSMASYNVDFDELDGKLIRVGLVAEK